MNKAQSPAVAAIRTAVAVIGAHVTIFRLLYWAVVVATFRHSAAGFATLEHGNLWFGALSALAVDVGMMLAAEHLQRRVTPALVAGLAVAAAASVYSQFLYAVVNADAIAVSAGASWLGAFGTDIINARVVILPVLLPLLAVIYSFAARDDDNVAPTPATGATVPQVTVTAPARAALSGDVLPALAEGAADDTAGATDSAPSYDVAARLAASMNGDRANLGGKALNGLLLGAGYPAVPESTARSWARKIARGEK